MKINKKGFTLIELLVVVLIIGILASIALAQYKLVVGKTQYTELKTLVSSLVESSQRFYLVNNVYPSKYEDLDIAIDKTSNTRAYYDTSEFDFDLSNGVRCAITQNSNYVVCSKKFWGIRVGYYKTLDTNKPLWCITEGLERTNMANRLCSAETGRDSNAIQCYSNHCYYPY